VEGGQWSSTVPERVTFEGRLAVRVGEDPAAARAALEARVGARARLRWTGGQFASADTATDAPIARLVAGAVGDGAVFAGVPWGADMRLFTARSIPTVMVGTHGLERGHAVDERVAVADLERLTRVLATVIARF
jgi:acetylornithine deacetylase